MQQTLGVAWTTVHYKGNAPATNDLIAGHVQFNFDQISVALPFIKDGRTRALAVTGTQRAHWVPDVPTFAELGYKSIIGETFTALLAPAGTPAPVIAKLSAALSEILRDPDVDREIRSGRCARRADVSGGDAQVSGERGRDLDADRAQGEHQGGVNSRSPLMPTTAGPSSLAKHWVPAFAGTNGSRANPNSFAGLSTKIRCRSSSPSVAR